VKESHKVVIIGGGFGGLYAAKALKGAPVQVTLLDRHNYHLFQPLLYQVATGFLSPADVASPLRSELKDQENARVILAEVIDIDVDGRKAITQDGEVAYDTLILAAGASHSYFGHPEWEPYAPGLKSVDDALEVCRRIFLAFETAESFADAEQREKWLTFVVVGGGPTGVEVAGALGETVLHTLKREYRSIDPGEVKIYLLEGGERILPAYPPGLSSSAVGSLEKLGVTVRTGNLVTDIEGDSVGVRIGESLENISAGTILWAAGVQASPLSRLLHDETNAQLDRAGRLVVEPDLTLSGHPEIFVIGDLANFSHQTGKPLPGLAQPAMQEGAYAARLIQRRLRGGTLPAFHYHDKGTLATIGRTSAVADLGNIKLTCFIGKLVWIFVHLWYITEFENKTLVFLQWGWNFLTMSQRARIIVGPRISSQPKPGILDAISEFAETGEPPHLAGAKKE
jgi:NADH dehydrogenase